MEKTEEKSIFLQFFGDTPQFRMIDFLMENRLKDFTKKEIAQGAGISWASLFNHWGKLERGKVVKVTRTVGRAKLYQLNERGQIARQLRAMELSLIKAASEQEEAVVAKVGSKGRHAQVAATA